MGRFQGGRTEAAPDRAAPEAKRHDRLEGGQPAGHRGEEQLVIFQLGQETYGVQIGSVREIIPMQPITRVPGAPAFVEGLINLRGHVIPVIDLHKRFSVKAAQGARQQRIMVAEVDGQVLGLVVDAVSEVLRVPWEQIESPEGVLAAIDAAFLRGVAKLEDRLVILLDLERLLLPAEFTEIRQMQEQPEGRHPEVQKLQGRPGE